LRSDFPKWKSLQLTIFGTGGHFPLEKSATNHTRTVSVNAVIIYRSGIFLEFKGLFFLRSVFPCFGFGALKKIIIGSGPYLFCPGTQGLRRKDPTRTCKKLSNLFARGTQAERRLPTPWWIKRAKRVREQMAMSLTCP
jgi:hypothetical protein